ncbi:flavin monoamine oxidase family protein [Streptomyces sp. NPDC002577]
MSGLVAAYELMKLGLKPVVYESAQIGGRLRGARQPGTDHPVADLGGMRFPRSARALFHYIDLLGLGTKPFPNPLTSASDSTVIEIAGRKHYAESPADLPRMFHEVAAAWQDCLEERAHFSVMQQAIADRDYATIKKLWNELVPLLDDMSFSHYLATSKAFSALPFEYREAFGLVGFGTGGWDTNFPDSMLEILRVVYVGAEDDQQRILGGAQRLPQLLLAARPRAARALARRDQPRLSARRLAPRRGAADSAGGRATGGRTGQRGEVLDDGFGPLLGEEVPGTVHLDDLGVQRRAGQHGPRGHQAPSLVPRPMNSGTRAENGPDGLGARDGRE